MIELRALDLRFGPRAALSAIDLVVGPGEIHGLIGPRGAGKTTLLRVLAGGSRSAPGTSGSTCSWFVTAIMRAYSLIEANLNPNTRRRMALALGALAGQSDVLLVDEPIDGIDPETAAATRTLVARHAARGGAVIWAARRLDDLQGVASGVTLLAAGRVRYSGTVEKKHSRCARWQGASPGPARPAAA